MYSGAATPEILLGLIEKLYAAAADSVKWTDFLKAFTEAAGSSHASLRIHDFKDGANSRAAKFGYSPEFTRNIQEYWGAHDLLWLKARPHLHTGWVHHSQQYLPDRMMLASGYFNECLRQEGLFYQCGVIIEHQETRNFALSTLRSRGAGPFGDEHLRLLRQLFPHLRRATEIQYRMTALNQRLLGMELVVERSSTGIVFVDGRGRVLFVNASAREIFRLRKGIWVEQGTVTACGLRQKEMLQKTIHSAAQTGEGKAVHPGEVLRIDSNDSVHPLVVTVTPFPYRPGLTPEGTAAALFITDPERTGKESGVLLESVYCLTPAERRLASILSSGCSLKEAAEQMHIQRSTAVSHLKSLFSKTSTRRQSELLRLLTLLNSHIE